MILCGHIYKEQIRKDGHFMVCKECGIEVYSSVFPIYDWIRTLTSKTGRSLTQRLFGEAFATKFYEDINQPLQKGGE